MMLFTVNVFAIPGSSGFCFELLISQSSITNSIHPNITNNFLYQTLVYQNMYLLFKTIHFLYQSVCQDVTYFQSIPEFTKNIYYVNGTYGHMVI